MSRGLGKVERFALAELRERAEGSSWPYPPPVTVREIAHRRAHDEWLAECGRVCEESHVCCDDESYDPTAAEYESMRRAVASLRRKGLVMYWWWTPGAEGIEEDVRFEAPSRCIALTPEGEDLGAKLSQC